MQISASIAERQSAAGRLPPAATSLFGASMSIASAGEVPFVAYDGGVDDLAADPPPAGRQLLAPAAWALRCAIQREEGRNYVRIGSLHERNAAEL